jgi:predicted peptidase
MTTRQQAKTFRRRLTLEARLDYLLFLPQGYAQRSAAPRWPAILFLHGSGERGANVRKVAAHGPPRIVKADPGFPFIVISPQCAARELWSEPVLLALVDEVTRKYRVDPARLYLTGLSMGGYATWQLGVSHPEKFAAIAPVCGGGDNLGILLAEPRRAKLLKRLPIWAFHGAKDRLVKLGESERMVDAFRQIGNQPRLTVYPDAEHDSWTETYANPALYDWFLKHRNPSHPASGRLRKRSQPRVRAASAR